MRARLDDGRCPRPASLGIVNGLLEIPIARVYLTGQILSVDRGYSMLGGDAGHSLVDEADDHRALADRGRAALH